MADIKSASERSKNMAAIRSKGTRPEVYLRKKLFARSYRYRKNVSYIYGHPDIYLAKYNTVIFVHGCFWHRHHGCKYAYTPKSRIDFWTNKFQKNVQRDKIVLDKLTEEQYKIIVIWKCSVKKMMKDADYEKEILDKISDFFISSELFLEL